MGSLDQESASTVKREVKILDVTGLKTIEIESACNDKYGASGWVTKQIYEAGGRLYVLMEKSE